MARGVVANNDDIFAQLAVQETPEDPLPESEWLANVGDKVNVTVKVPVHQNRDCLLRRQDSNMEVSLRSTAIKLRKEKAIARVIGIPAKNSEKTEVAMGGGRPYDKSDVSCFL
jgi:hypothetical protein